MMHCPRCNGGLIVLNVYSAGARAETRNLKCDRCGFRSSSITFLVDRPQERKHGSGGHALAKKIEAGQIEPPDIADG